MICVFKRCRFIDFLFNIQRNFGVQLGPQAIRDAGLIAKLEHHIGKKLRIDVNFHKASLV